VDVLVIKISRMHSATYHVILVNGDTTCESGAVPTPYKRNSPSLARLFPSLEGKDEGKKTYNSGYSLVVTHLTTNPPVRCLNRAERTGSLVFNVLWSYVKELIFYYLYQCFDRYTIPALFQLFFLGSAKAGLVRSSVQTHRRDALCRNRTR
jgi:hypothetical protein